MLLSEDVLEKIESLYNINAINITLIDFLIENNFHYC